MNFGLSRRFAAVAAAVILSLATQAAAVEVPEEAPAPPVRVRSASEVYLLFDSESGPAETVRPAPQLQSLAPTAMDPQAKRVEGIIRALVEGPDERERILGLKPFLPDGTILSDVKVTSESTAVEIYVVLPTNFVNGPGYSPSFVEEVGHHFIDSLHLEEVRHFLFMVEDPDSGEFVGIRKLLPENRNTQTETPPPAEPVASEPKASTAEIDTRSAPQSPHPGSVSGALSGRAIVLNQSHGWFDHTSFGRWRIQRTRTFEQVEDYSSGEFMNHYVVPLLLNAGARVQPVREPDAQTNMVIVDNAAGSPTYVETGLWSNSSVRGFVNKVGASWNGTTFNPFNNSSATRFANVAPLNTPTATASYIPNIPATGYYNVYISYSTGTNRSSAAHWQVHHSGGVADFRINQKIDGATWLLIGNFHFEQGTGGKVMLLNDASEGSVVTCDAVRFGGGMGDVARRTFGVSGRQRWTEDACNYLSFLGGYFDEPVGTADGPLWGDDTVGSTDEQLGWANRPQYARWEQQRDGEGNNVIYLGWHTNASSFACDANGNEVSGTGRGTGSYRDVDLDATPGTINLTSAVHNSFIDGVRKFYSSTWQNRGIVASNSYGECNQVSLGSVSGFFFEGLFHDNSADAAIYKDPKFRNIMARGIVQGIISYYGGTVFPPEPPTNLRIRNIGSNQARLDWKLGPVRTATVPYGSAPTKYRIYRSTNGYGFDSGTDTADTSTFFTTSLTPGQTYFFRVAAVNSAGVSIPTETLAVRLPVSGGTNILIVNGSDRYDRHLPKLISVPQVGGCSAANPNMLREVDPRKFQSFNYIIQHAKAMANAGAAFDSAANECIEESNIALSSYFIVDWIGAQEAEADTGDNEDNTALKPTMRNSIQSFLQGGGRLLMTTSELAWDFGRSTAAADKKTFLTSYMKANYVADDSNTYQVSSSSGIFTGLPAFNYDNGSGNTYDTRFPDVLTPAGGSTACMTYSTGGTAAIQYSGTFGASSIPAKLVYMGVGFETILSESVHNQAMANILNFFAATAVEEWQTH